MPLHETEADQLASSYLIGAYSGAAFNAAPLFRVRQSAKLGQAVASGRCAGQAVRAEGLITGRGDAVSPLPAPLFLCPVSQVPQLSWDKNATIVPGKGR